MFSSRLDWDQRPNAISRLLEQKRTAGAEVLDLTESNPTRAGLDYADAEILKALSNPRSLRYEPCPAGLGEARQAIAGYYGCVEPEQVLLTASTSEAYAWLFKLLADPGGEVLVPRPSYPLFDHLAALECVTLRQYPLRYTEGWWIDLHALEAAASAHSRAVIVVNPNNPTGSYLRRGDLERLSRTGLALISDEVFSDYALCPAADRVTHAAAYAGTLTFALGGLSKLAGLPQMKLGWVVVSGPGWQQAIERLQWIADVYLSVSAPVQHAAAGWLALRERFQAGVVERLRGNLEYVSQRLETLQVEGGWYATLRLPRTRTEEEWALLLLDEENVLVQPGYFFDFEEEAYAVVSLLSLPRDFREGIGRIARRIHGRG